MSNFLQSLESQTRKFSSNMEKDNYKNAIAYIKESSLYSSSRYIWIRDLIDKCLNDSISDHDIINALNKKLQIETTPDIVNTKETIEDEKVSKEKSDTFASSKFDLEQIISIEEATNTGLLNIQNPIPIKKGLNIFYGKNGAGKSSLYHPVCKTLGFNKHVNSKINSESEICAFKLKAISKDHNEHTFSWKTGEENQRCNVKIFDSNISNFLVESDQENNFNITHLRSEYFSILHSMFEEIAKLLTQKEREFSEILRTKREVINSTFPDFFERDSKVWTKDKIKETTQTDKELESLSQIEGSYKVLERSDSESIIKNITNARDQLISVLEGLGIQKQIEDENGKIQQKWTLIFDTDYFIRLSENMNLFRNGKQTFENQGLEILAGNINEEWIKNDKWNDFIKSGIDFVKSLEENEVKKYNEEKCPYCQQNLASDKAKSLISAYYMIQDELKQKLNEYEEGFKSIVSQLTELIELQKKIKRTNIIIEAELKHIGIRNKKIQLLELDEEINQLIANINERNFIVLKEELSGKIESFWQEYIGLLEKFNFQINTLNIGLNTKIEKITILKGQAKPHQFINKIVNQKSNLLTFIEAEETLSTIDVLNSDISSIKQALSGLETRFTKEEPLKIFKEYLEKEYKYFDFTPPDSWSIKTSTRGQTNKRIYSLGDKRISDIFSEGERKIHALADFFAECELNRFKGVYIFDDPVNSLDEERIEYVSDRIISLLNDGNQVIVFTHNLVFLNLLADTQQDRLHKLNRLSDQVIIEPNILMDSQQELSKIRIEIDKRIKILKKTEESSINIMDLRNVYDLISGYLETYVEGKIFKNIITRYRPNIRMQSLEKLESIDIDKIKKLITLYNQTSRKGSRHSQPIGSPAPKYSDLMKHYEELKIEFPVN